MTSDDWSLVVNGATLAVNAVGLTFVAIQVILARRQILQSQEQLAVENLRLSRQATISFYHSTVDIRTKWRSVMPSDWDAVAVRTFVAEAFDEAPTDGTKMNYLVDYFAYMEGLAVAIAAGAYDLDTLDALAGDRLIALSENYRPFFERSRATLATPALYVEFEWLGERLRELRSKSPDYVLFSRRSPLPTPTGTVRT